MIKWMKKRVSISMGSILGVLLCTSAVVIFAAWNPGFIGAVKDRCGDILNGSSEISEEGVREQEVYAGENSLDLGNYAPLSYEENEWFNNIKAIAHGGGAN